MSGWRGGRLHPVRGDGVEGWSGAAGARWQGGCGRSIAAALVCVGRYRDSRVDGRPVPHVFLCGPLPFSFAKKKRPHPLRNAVFYETGRRVRNGPNTLLGRFRSWCNSVAALVLQLLPGAAVLFFRYGLSAHFGEGCAQNGTATRRVRGEMGTPHPGACDSGRFRHLAARYSERGEERRLPAPVANQSAPRTGRG